MDLIKIKNFYSAQDTFKKKRTQTTEQEKILAEDISDKGLLSKLYKKLKIQQEENNPILKCTKDMNKHLIKEGST